MNNLLLKNTMLWILCYEEKWFVGHYNNIKQVTKCYVYFKLIIFTGLKMHCEIMRDIKMIILAILGKVMKWHATVL